MNVNMATALGSARMARSLREGGMREEDIRAYERYAVERVEGTRRGRDTSTVV